MNHIHYPIIIIGAGLAGLAAATHLRAHGIQTILLEARNRPGGRIWIDDSLGVPIGKGASWIHGTTDNPMMSLSDPSIPLFTLERSLYHCFDRHGHKIPQKIIDDFNQRFENVLEKAKKFAFSSHEDIPLSEAIAHYFKAEDLQPIEQDLFLRKLKFFENYIGDNDIYLSARHWDDEEILAGSHGVLKDAYASIIKKLSNNLDIRFDTKVRAIKINKNAVDIHTNDKTYSAKIVLITVPLGVLKQEGITFDPPLSLKKQKVIRNIGMGLFNIIALRFREFFWDPSSHAYFLPEKNAFGMFYNIGHFLEIPIILGYAGGDTARKLEKLEDKEIIQSILTSFKKYFKKEIPFPEKYFITRWLDDPFSKGSYSYYATGRSNQDREILAEPIDHCVFFAGEATHTQFPATTHGAYLSGIREANNILKIISQ